MRTAALKRWLAERVPVPMEELRKPLREELPAHLRGWLFWLGGTPLVLFCIQVVTGIMLTFYYTPSPMYASAMPRWARAYIESRAIACSKNASARRIDGGVRCCTASRPRR